MRPKDRFGKKVFRKTPKQTKRVSEKKKPAKRECCLCDRIMQGVPSGKNVSETRKMSKTEKRPTAIFAGILCNKCRATVLEEALKIKYAGKPIEKSSIKTRKFVTEAMNKIE